MHRLPARRTPACVSSASPCCAASTPGPARSGRWCSAWTVRWSRARPNRPRRASSGPTAPSSMPRSCGPPALGAAPGRWRRCPTPARSAASRSPASARPVCCSAADGAALAPIIAWYDTRTTGELEWLLTEVGFEALHRITGLCADPTFSLLKLLWYRRQQPELLGAARAGSTSATIWPGGCAASGRPTSAWPRARMLLDLEHGGAGRQHSWMRRELPPTLLPPIAPERQSDRHASRPMSPPRPVCRRTVSSASAVTTMSAA